MNKALFVGINSYPSCPLRGCVNDIKYMSKLSYSLGFSEAQTSILLDSNATYKNMYNELLKLVSNSSSGDILLFHFSGHGAQAPVTGTTAQYELDSLDECLVPYDFVRTGLIRDDDLFNIFSKLAKGSLLYIILDACHSGLGTRSISDSLPRTVGIVGNSTSIVKDIYPISDVAREVNASSEMGDIILFSGCQSDQTSADAFIDNEYQGALSYNIRKVCDPYIEIDGLTNEMMINSLNLSMDNLGFTQNPVLECKEEYKTRGFLK